MPFALYSACSSPRRRKERLPLSATPLPRVPPHLALPAVCRLGRSISTFNFELSTSFFSTFPPSNVQTLSLPPSLPTAHCSLPTIFFRINTCKSLSKQTTLTLFRNIDLQKTGGRGVLWLTRHATKHVCPVYHKPRRERPSGAKDCPSAYSASPRYLFSAFWVHCPPRAPRSASALSSFFLLTTKD